MIPIPPTSSEIEATIASNSPITRALPSRASATWLMFRMSKSATSPGWILCRVSRIPRTWIRAAPTSSALSLVRRSGSRSPSAWAGCRRGSAGSHRSRCPASRSGSGRRRRGPSFAGGEGDQDDVVLIASIARLSELRQDSDDAQGHVLHEHGGPDRILMRAEELADDGPPKQAHAGCALLLFRGEHATRSQGPVLDLQVARAHALDGRVPV